MRRRTYVVLAVAAAAAPAASAAAAPPWEPERTVASPPGGVGSAAIEFRRTGSAQLSWLEYSPGDPKPRMRLATLRQDGSVLLGGRLAAAPDAGPAFYGNDGVVLLRRRELGRPERRSGLQRYRLDALFGSTGRSASGRSHRVATFRTYPGAEPFELGVDERGQAAVAWVDLRPAASGPGSFRVHVAFGRAGRGFGRPVTLESRRLTGADDVSAFAIAHSAGGDLVVAYTTTRRRRLVVAVRVLRRGGALAPPQVLGRRDAITALTTATAPDGRTVVAWGTQDGGEEANRPWVVQAAVRPAGGRFGRAQILDPGGAPWRVPGRVALDMTADGRATIAWSNATLRGSAIGYPVRTASTGRTGGFGRITELAAHGAVEDVVAAPDGGTLVAWSAYNDEEQPPLPLYAQLRPAGTAAFGVPELVSSHDAVVYSADVAFDPRTGRPVAAWVEPDQAVAASVLRLSTRTG